MFQIDMGFILNKSGQFFLLNFSSVLLVILFFSMLLRIWNKRKHKMVKKIVQGSFTSCAGLVGGMSGFIFFSFFFVTASLYRYNVAAILAFVIFVIIILENLSSDKAKKKMTVMYGIVVVLFLLQSYMDIDILSKQIFEVLETGGIKKIYSDYQSNYYGDGMVNNYQYAWLDKLFDEMLKDVQYSENMDIILPGMEASGTQIDSGGGYGEGRFGWDLTTQKRKIIDDDILEDNLDIIEISIQRTDDLIGKLPRDYEGLNEKTYESMKDRAVIFFLPYYKEDEAFHLRALSYYYYIGERRQQKNWGGIIYYYELYKKENYRGFELTDFIDEEKNIKEYKNPSFREYMYRNADSVKYEQSPGTINDGDNILFTYQAYIDKELLPENITNTYYGNECNVTIGSGKLIEGLEECFIGKRAGDVFDYDWKVPSDYLPAIQYAGQTISFKIRINRITGYTDIEFLADKKKADIVEAFAYEQGLMAEQQLRLLCIELVKNEEYGEIPEESVSQERHAIREYLNRYLETIEFTEEEFIAHYFGGDEETYNMAIDHMSEASALYNISTRLSDRTEVSD